MSHEFVLLLISYYIQIRSLGEQNITQNYYYCFSFETRQAKWLKMAFRALILKENITDCFFACALYIRGSYNLYLFCLLMILISTLLTCHVIIRS